jgi:hypothetical protein
MSISSIDDLLAGGKTHTQPETPENQYQDGPEEIEEMDSDAPPLDDSSGDDADDRPSHEDTGDEADEEDSDDTQSHENDYDDYGNEKPKPRMYTEEEHKDLLNRAVRERLARLERNNPDAVQQPTNQQIQNQTKNFEYDPNSEQSLPQQLETFIEQTVTKMTGKKEQQAREQQERELHAAFEDKLISGMQRFGDFRDVVGQYEITNPMTLATRDMADPAAFLYAAAKRHPQELERIAKLRDPYSQIREMGKLDERMRRNKPTTKAPRPIGRTTEDAPSKAPKKQQDVSGDDLLAKADSKRLSQVKQRHRGNR